MRKNVLETKGVLTALVLVTGALLWPSISFAGVEARLSDDSYTDSGKPTSNFDGTATINISTANVNSTQCIGNAWFGTDKHAACPAAVAANTYTNEVTLLHGPMPASGVTVSNLEAVTTGTPTTGQSYTVDLIDNTTGTTVLSCSVTSTSSSFCTNTGSASVAAGHYLEVKITNVGSGVSSEAWRVSFRY